jgi:hypothetical protein
VEVTGVERLLLVAQARVDVGVAGGDRPPVHVEGAQGHRAVDVHREAGHTSVVHQPAEVVQHHLGAVDGERGHDDRAAPRRGPFDQ